MSDDLRVKYDNYKKDYEGIVNSKKDRATSYRLESPRLKKRIGKGTDLIGWLKNESLTSSEEEGNSQVRDTQAATPHLTVMKICHNILIMRLLQKSLQVLQ